MKKGVYSVHVELDFSNLTLDEVHSLELYMRSGLEDKSWGEVKMDISLRMTGSRMDSVKEQMTAKKLLEEEKKAVAKK